MRHLFCVAALAAVASSSASGAIYHWDWDRGGPGTSGLNDAGGVFESITATFNDVTDRLEWSMTFSNQVTNGFFLALNNGPNPKGHAGELALLYVDARNPGNVALTAYGYNGQNSISSYYDGDGVTSGNQAADVIKNTLDRASWVLNAGVIDAGGKRTIFFDIDATDLIDRTPLYPDPVDPYYGIGFGAKLGLWLHTFRQFDVTYGPSGTITNIATGGEGWFDGTNLNTVPAPGAAMVGLVGAAAALRRRRA
jgi:uncharacterized protein (TIGR03382 family)